MEKKTTEEAKRPKPNAFAFKGKYDLSSVGSIVYGAMTYLAEVHPWDFVAVIRTSGVGSRFHSSTILPKLWYQSLRQPSFFRKFHSSAILPEVWYQSLRQPSFLRVGIKANTIQIPLPLNFTSMKRNPCGNCFYCSKGHDDLCKEFFAFDRAKGTLCDSETWLFLRNGVLPDSLPYAEFAILGCAIFTAYGAMAYIT
ncbi:hypothetical protein K1719_027557 [Acacia pycnantha]|nr:hypothetical protein K1719_027557 [Acacia pycnantha]